MIAKMRKYTFLVFYKDYNHFLLKLRDLGVIHIKEKQKGSISENSELYNWLNCKKRLKESLRHLFTIQKEHQIRDLKPADNNVNGTDLLERTEQLLAERDRITHQIQTTKKELERITPWGHFEFENINKLQEAGLYVHFHTVSDSKFDKNWETQYNAITISQISSVRYFITITNDSAFPNINTEHIKLFGKSLEKLENEEKHLHNDLDEANLKLQHIVRNCLNTLIAVENEIDDHVNWNTVLLNSEPKAEDKVILLEGYVPVENADEISQITTSEDIYFEATEIKPNENPPILYKNNKFAKLFEMISDLYDRPSYHAFDLTSLYAPFYIIFFGLCVGDCGYGLLYILISFFLRKSKNTFMSSVGKLTFWLGIGTVIFGFVSGTFFGIPMLEQSWAWLANFKMFILDNNQLFYFALILGAIQITYAMIIRAITACIRFGVLYAMDTFGWLITLWGNATVFFIAQQGLISEKTTSTLHYLAYGTGIFMMLFFNNIEKGIKGLPGSIGSGLWGVYNKVSGLLSDMLSYIRLFALGISGAVLGLVFNQLAFDFAPDVIILKQLVIIMILLFGHGINIFLCSLSAFVHPLRLTFVEFYNNAGFEGGGKKYNPFKKNAK